MPEMQQRFRDALRSMHPAAAAVVLASCVIRMLGLFRPLLGNFAGYQTSNGMMARFFIDEHFSSLFYPQVNVLAAGKPGLVLLAYPVHSLMVAVLFSFFGGSIDVWGRLVAVFFFAGAAFYLYLLVRTLVNEQIAIGSLIAFSLSPLSIIYGQSFQNEMATVFFSVVFMFHLLKLLESGGMWNYASSILGLTGVLITRPNALYLLLPALVLTYQVKGEETRTNSKWMAFSMAVVAGSVLPGIWYWHIWKTSNHAANIYSTLYAQLMLRSSFISPLVFSLKYYQELFDHLVGIGLTPIGFTLLIFGTLSGTVPAPKKRFFILWCAAFLLSSLLIPRKLVDHNFYLLHLVVPAAPLIASGFIQIFRTLRTGRNSRLIFLSTFLLISIFVSLRYALHPAFKTPDKEKHLLQMAEDVKSFTGKKVSRVLVQGTHTLLYYADRYGWGFTIDRRGNISDYEKYTNWQKLPPGQWRQRNKAFLDLRTTLEYYRQYEGATHFVVTDPEEFNRAHDFAAYVLDHFPVLLQKTDKLILFDLTYKRK